MDSLKIRGARTHNLKNISLELPRNKLTVITGLSGSGKSSLAFDTLYAEGQRRYVESLSAYARQFLGQVDKPDVDFIEGLSPAISIDQKSASRNPRSTVGTITEVYDYLRLLYARIGQPHCPRCGRPVSRQTPTQIVDRLMELEDGTRFQVLAPVVRGRKGEYEGLLDDLARQGFARARVDGEVVELAERRPERLARYEQHTIEVVVDRLVRRDGIERRLTDSLETALSLAQGLVGIHLLDADETLLFSEELACVVDGLSFEELAPRSFSFNSPYGACPTCTGLGTRFEVDPELVVPDPERSLADGAVAPWAGAGRSEFFTRVLEAVAGVVGASTSAPWRSLTKAQRDAVLYGLDGEKVTVSYRNRYGRRRSFETSFSGVVPWLTRRHGEVESDHARAQIEGYMREVPCPACRGTRLKPESLAVTVGGRNIAELCALSIRAAAAAVGELELSERDQLIAERVLKEVRARLAFLLDVGLDYLTLDRSAATLAGGEAQRIRLASQIGSGLVGVLYVLDEPSIGLHQRDNHRLIETLRRLRDLGNTVIVVEHDEDTIRVADHVVDIGPGAGEHGGRVVVAGTVGEVAACAESVTGRYLSGRARIDVPAQRRPAGERWLWVRGAAEHNLTGIDVGFPLGCLVAVTGVSGSGKSTLVNDILLRALQAQLQRARVTPGRHRRVEGVEQLDKVIAIDQAPIGRTPRSNPATYSGVFDHIRRLFSQTNEAKVRGYGPGRFSFNIRGGRCEACAGDGTIRIEMNFLPDVYVPCEVCKGARYNRDTLDVTWKGHTIAEVLDLSCEEGLALFENQPVIARHLQTLVDVGLSYVRLGQPAPTLSGGEAQRVKLASELARRSTGRTLYVLDEPTTGLHFEDVRKLLGVLTRLVDAGNTVVVIEHNLDVVKTADWVVDLGPDGGDRGGRLVVEGTPETVVACPESHTGRYLAPLLGLDPAGGAPAGAGAPASAEASSGTEAPAAAAAPRSSRSRTRRPAAKRAAAG